MNIEVFETIAVPCGGNLNIGIKKRSLVSILKKEAISNPEIVAYFSWKNGSVLDDDTLMPNSEFCSFGYLLTLENALKIYNHKVFLGFKQRGLFPIMSDYTGNYLLLDAFEPDKGVFIFSPSLFIIEPEIVFSNFDALFAAVQECYKQKAYWFENNQLVVDMDMEDIIFKQNDITYLKWAENR